MQELRVNKFLACTILRRTGKVVGEGGLETYIYKRSYKYSLLMFNLVEIICLSTLFFIIVNLILMPNHF